MYQPEPFREQRLSVQHDLIQRHPLGLLVTHGASGLCANLLPFHLALAPSTNGRLEAHLARANPQVEDLKSGAEVLVIFQGPEAYVTPSWYPSKQPSGRAVPTWNYVTVQVRGRPQLVESDAWLRQHLHRLTQQQEQGRAEPWEVGDAPEAYIAGQLKGIVGLEVEIDQLEGKWKISQNRSRPDQHGVIAGLQEEGADAMATLMTQWATDKD
ncbi:FMN-binding negative transcriptional regulator [Deinococcus ficus]|uniref:FMN-binding negative transcriptional regulator n=1 Tax=Deinococcus ficus TaxID=317577 RepID=UPI0003B5F3F9|nr:FMN-binding negative transcriptional regulator [Deinococcus ficus]